MAVSPEDSEDLGAEVARHYVEAETSLLGRIASFVGLNLDSDSWTSQRRNGAGAVRRAIGSLIGGLFNKGRKAAANAAKEAAKRGVAAADDELGKAAENLGPADGTAAKAGTKAMVDDLKVVEKTMAKQALTSYQRIVTEVTQAVVNGTGTRKTAASRALARFANAGITGFVDKAGRNWEIATYVEMAIRTHAANTMVEAHLGRLESAGVKLVIVSDAPYECELCKPWEGKILEVGGPKGKHSVKVKQGNKEITVKVDGSLEEARSKGLFHPNCRHNITGYLPGVSRAAEKPDTKGVTYKDTQEQRSLERAARKWDRRRAVALDDEERKAAEAKFNEYRARIRAHTKRTGLPRKSNRERHDATR